MVSSIEQALNALVNLFTLAKRPPPDRTALGDFRPALSGLCRDEDGLIMQATGAGPGADEKAPRCRDESGSVMPACAGRPDGGDSAHRSGVLAFCNSERDGRNLSSYMVELGLMTRHPRQEPWNNPRNCSRDQLMGFAAGCWRAGHTNFVTDLLSAAEKRTPPYTCQNTESDVPGSIKFPPIGDLLAPHEIMYLRIIAGDVSAAADMVGQLSLYLAIVTTPTDADTELNQVVLMSIVCGQLDIFVQYHSNFGEALNSYWGGNPWRGQQCIADSLVEVINLEMARYTPASLLDILVPRNLLDELRHLDLAAAAQSFLTGNPFVFAELQARFLVAALRDLQEHIQNLERSLTTLNAISKEVAVAVIVVLRAAAADAYGKFQTMVERSHIDPTGITSTMLSIAAAVLGFGSSGPSAEELEFRARTTLALAQITRNTEVAIAAVGALQVSMMNKFAELTSFIREEFYSLVLNEIKGKILNANVLLDTIGASAITPAIRERLERAVDDLRTMIVRVADFGPATLGYCFQAYGVVIALLTAGGDNGTEIDSSRLALRTIFRDLLDDANGPMAQWNTLKSIEESSETEFSNMQTEFLIGVFSDEQSKDWYGPGNRDEPLIVGTGQWDIAGIFITVVNDITQPALVATKIDRRVLGTFDEAIYNIAGLSVLGKAVPLAPQAQFVVAPVTTPWQGRYADIDLQCVAWLALAQKLSHRYNNSRRVQPNIAALATGVKAAFRI